jgi:hypothetical protein
MQADRRGVEAKRKSNDHLLIAQRNEPLKANLSSYGKQCSIDL